jgi:hypothetical protein
MTGSRRPRRKSLDLVSFEADGIKRAGRRGSAAVQFAEGLSQPAEVVVKMITMGIDGSNRTTTRKKRIVT